MGESFQVLVASKGVDEEKAGGVGRFEFWQTEESVSLGSLHVALLSIGEPILLERCRQRRSQLRLYDLQKYTKVKTT